MSVKGTMDWTQISRYQDPEIRVLSNFRSLFISFQNKKKCVTKLFRNRILSPKMYFYTDNNVFNAREKKIAREWPSLLILPNTFLFCFFFGRTETGEFCKHFIEYVATD